MTGFSVEQLIAQAVAGGAVDVLYKPFAVGDLLDALKKGEIYGAALDAMEVEPPTVETYGEGLLSCPNIIMTPHIGASTVENQSQSGIAVVDTLLAVLAGQEVPNRLV